MSYYRLDVYVPETHVDAVRVALATAGAGRLGPYDSCSFVCSGYGHFRPLPGATPYLGQIGQAEITPEWKIEVVCAQEYLAEAIAAMLAVHPYQTPAYQYWPVALTPPES